MSLIAKLKKSLILTVFTILIGVISPLSLTAHADEVTQWFNDLFSTGGDTISFTDFEGQLAQLNPEGYDTALTSSTDVREFIIRIVNFALGFLGLIAVLIVIYGGVLYVTAGGEEEKTQKGKKAIAYATIGLLIVLGSFAFVNTVIKGGTGGIDATGKIGAETYTSKGGFNASAEQLRAYAVEIFNGFKFVSETTEELRIVQNDATKSSLAPWNLPSKSTVIAFLTTTKSKFTNLKNRLEPFSDGEAVINELLRSIEKEIDVINSLGGTIYIKQPSKDAEDVSVCDPGDAEDFFVDANKTEQEICADEGEDGYKISYTNGLYKSWKAIYEKYSTGTMKDSKGAIVKLFGDKENLYEAVLATVSVDYQERLVEIFRGMDVIFESFSGIDAIYTGEGNNAYTSMKTSLGYSINNGIVTNSSSGFYSSIVVWDVDSNVAETGNYMMQGLTHLATLYDKISQLQFVQVRLTANITEGAAPLNVLFDTLGSLDPAGGSIDGNNITWDLGGGKTITELMSAATGTLDEEGDGFSCVFEVPQDANVEDYIGTTAKRCTFDRPGTYRAAVKIKSKEPKKYAPGIAVITIKVKPPTTKIHLDVTPPGEKTITVMSYSGDLLTADRKTVQITSKNSEEIVFNANVTNKTDAKFYKWDFGDGEITNFETSATYKKTYKEPGKYKVTLEVMNEVGVIDRKVFTVEISSIAARISPQPETGAFVNTPVSFDAGGSKSDLGKIINYAWEIDYVEDQEIDAKVKSDLNKIYPLKESGSNLKVLTHTFKYPVKYRITVTVRDNSTSKLEATETIDNYQLKSKPPVAVFDYSVPKKNQPGLYYFDGKKSYDPDGQGELDYAWSITPEDGRAVVDGVAHGLDSAQPIIKFTKKGEYEVKLKVSDKVAEEEYHEIVKTVKVDNILGVQWKEGQKSTETLKLNQQTNILEAAAKFSFVADNAVAYEIDFGDGETETDDINPSSGAATEASHTYLEAGKFNVKLTVYDEDDNENSIERKFFVGGSDKPIAKIKLFINGEEHFDLSKPVKISKKDNLEFDAGDSKNTDGTAKDLVYSWDFGNTKTSSKKKATTTYKEFSPKDPGYFKVKLKVSDKDDPSKSLNCPQCEDEIQLDVINKAPIYSSIEAIPQIFSADLVTPVTVNMKVFGAEDTDGDIVKYKWWYFDEDDHEEPLGLQITNSPSAQLIIGTRGKEGQKITYGFGLEITDSDSSVYSNKEAIDDGNYAKITVINGANAVPVAKFSISSSSIYTGEKVTLTSASTDPDGKIEKYYWDVEGNGFFDNEPKKEPVLEHEFTTKNKEGYEVRLKVVDDKGGEDISDPIKIYVDSLAKPPVAAFKHEVVQGSEGMKIKFINNSTVDESAGSKIISYKWDFDAESQNENADSDGDGKKDNDTDSQAENPDRLFIEHGTYKIKLTITDDQGNTDDVINTITIPLANPPTAAFTYEVKGDKVVFKNNSTGDPKAGTIVDDFAWDFDTASNLQNVDSDGDGFKDNDKDSTEKNPTYKYSAPGIYRVKLLVTDNQGNIDDVINEVNFALPTADNVGAGTIADGTSGGTGTATNTGATTTTGTGTASPQIALKAVLIATPAPSADGIVHLTGDNQSIKFDFTKSLGPITYYIIDKNIYFDTNGDGVKNNDEDFKTSLPGNWKTNFDKAWGKIVVKLTVRDLYGNENSTNLEVKFNMAQP